MNKSKLRFLLIPLILGVIAIATKTDIYNELSLESIKSNQTKLVETYKDSPNQTRAIFFGIYIFVTALNIPAATILSLAAGAIFGFFQGLVLVSFASTIGATISFGLSRYLLQSWVEKHFKKFIEPINKGINDEGPFYLATMRLMPIFPFFVINLCMGLTQMNILRYYLVSQLAMLPGTAIYINAGLQLSKIETLQDILNPTFFASFMLLGLFPLIAKKAIAMMANRADNDVT